MGKGIVLLGASVTHFFPEIIDLIFNQADEE